MKHFVRKLLPLLALSLALAETAHGADGAWLTDFPRALEKARADKRLVLLDFTGSDWCSSCIALHKEVFPSKVFKDYTRGRFVLVEVDFPERRKISAAQKKANEELKEKFRIKAFPTLLVLNADGEKLGQIVGYDGNGPQAVIAELEKLTAAK